MERPCHERVIVPDVQADEIVSYPGARRPDRQWAVDSHGLSIAAYQWGEDSAPPVFLAHGGFDFAGTFDGFAPRLADAGWRVIGWDQRGHGDSEHAALYNWDADLRDAVAVIRSSSSGPVPVVGHSKGGGLMMALSEVRPDLISHLVNLDGLPSKRTMPDIPDRERTRMMATELSNRLDHRREAHLNQRKPGTLDELADRRANMNPRLDREWLRRLVTIGARHDDHGWRWKIDPSMRFGGFGPNRPEWALARLPGLRVPLLALLGLEVEEMGWGTEPDDVEPWLPPGATFEILEDVGHFVHIEQPDRVANLVLEFLS